MHPVTTDTAHDLAAYRRHAREWLEAHLPTHMRADSLDYRAPILEESRDWEASMYRAGLVGMTWPTAYGGLGLTLREHLVVNKEVGALPMPESISSIGKELAGLRWLLLATWGVYPISYAFPMLGLDGADAFVYRQVGYSIADVLAKCLYGLLIFKIARIKSMDDSPEFAEAEMKEAPSSK